MQSQTEHTVCHVYNQHLSGYMWDYMSASMPASMCEVLLLLLLDLDVSRCLHILYPVVNSITLRPLLFYGCVIACLITVSRLTWVKHAFSVHFLMLWITILYDTTAIFTSTSLSLFTRVAVGYITEIFCPVLFHASAGYPLPWWTYIKCRPLLEDITLIITYQNHTPTSATMNTVRRLWRALSGEDSVDYEVTDVMAPSVTGGGRPWAQQPHLSWDLSNQLSEEWDNRVVPPSQHTVVQSPPLGSNQHTPSTILSHSCQSRQARKSQDHSSASRKSKTGPHLAAAATDKQMSDITLNDPSHYDTSKQTGSGELSDSHTESHAATNKHTRTIQATLGQCESHNVTNTHNTSRDMSGRHSVSPRHTQTRRRSRNVPGSQSQSPDVSGESPDVTPRHRRAHNVPGRQSQSPDVSGESPDVTPRHRRSHNVPGRKSQSPDVSGESPDVTPRHRRAHNVPGRQSQSPDVSGESPDVTPRHRRSHNVPSRQSQSPDVSGESPDVTPRHRRSHNVPSRQSQSDVQSESPDVTYVTSQSSLADWTSQSPDITDKSSQSPNSTGRASRSTIIRKQSPSSVSKTSHSTMLCQSYDSDSTYDSPIIKSRQMRSVESESGDTDGGNSGSVRRPNHADHLDQHQRITPLRPQKGVFSHQTRNVYLTC